MSSWSNEETLAFLDLYRNERDIWDPKSKHYKDRIKINEAWNRISKTMNIKVPHLKRRKDILMATYRTIRRKLKRSRSKGKGGFYYKPTWVFYDAMQGFLKEIYDCVNPYYTPSEYRVTSKYLDTSPENMENIEMLEDEMLEEPDEDVKYAISDSKNQTLYNFEESENYFTNAEDISNDLQSSQINSEQIDEDECDLYGKLLAKKLRSFTKDDRLDIMYEIDGRILVKLLK